MVLSGMILGMIILNFRGMKLVQKFFVSFFYEVLFPNKFCNSYTYSSEHDEILGKNNVQQGLKRGHLHVIILCCSYFFIVKII